MSELVFHKIQWGQEAVEGVPVAATTVFPTDVGAVSDLDRAPFSPDEDYGGISRTRPGRPYYGVRASKVTATGELRFEDCISLFAMHFQGGVTPTPSGGLYSWVFTGDETSDSLKTRTIEEGTIDGQAYQIPGGLVDTLTLGYNALAAPGDSPWTFTANIIGWAREPVTFTAAVSAPSNMETIQGHLTTLAEGSNSVAYGSLTELANSLIMYKLTSNANLRLRAYGNSSQDRASAHGRKRHEITFEAMLKVSTAVKNDIWSIYNALGPVQQKRRWRIKANGGTGQALTIDHTVQFSSVPTGDRDGEFTYHVQGEATFDPSLGAAGSQIQITVLNGMGSQP